MVARSIPPRRPLGATLRFSLSRPQSSSCSALPGPACSAGFRAAGSGWAGWCRAGSACGLVQRERVRQRGAGQDLAREQVLLMSQDPEFELDAVTGIGGLEQLLTGFKRGLQGGGDEVGERLRA